MIEGERHLVLHGIDQGGDAGVVEGGVADRGDDGRLDAGMHVAGREAQAGAHRDLGPQGVERRVHAEDGAADVAGHHHVVLLEAGLAQRLVDRHERASVWTAGADGDRPGRRELLGAGLSLEEIGRDREVERGGDALHDVAHAVLADALEAPVQFAHDPRRQSQLSRLDVELLLEVRLELFEHQNGAAVTQQRVRLRGRERVDRLDLEDGGLFRLEAVAPGDLEALGQVRGRDPRRDDAEAALLAEAQRVEAGFGDPARRPSRAGR